jgi:IS5 family transposase
MEFTMRTDKMTLTDYEIQNTLAKLNHFLLQLDENINWDRVKKCLEPLDPSRKNVAGRDSYEPLKMFKVMLVQSWYDLSDPEMEFYLSTNLIFMNFCQFSITESKPDHSTICRWRNRFAESGLFDSIFQGIMDELHDLGLEIRHGKMVDATLVTAHARPRKKVIIETEPTGDDEITTIPTFEKSEVTVEESRDPDAHWITKGKTSTYGYKAHAVVDSNGIVESLSVTSANVHDTVMFPDLIDKAPLSEGDTVYADKGYHSEKNKEILKQRKLVDKIMHKRKRNEPDNAQQTERNKLISQRRYVVERTFGSLKRSYGWSRSRYLGLLKTTFYLQMRCLAFNIKRALKVISLSPV